jgi:hypothetical protein
MDTRSLMMKLNFSLCIIHCNPALFHLGLSETSNPSMQIWKQQQLWLSLESGANKLDWEIASFHGGMVKAKKTCKPNIILKVND